MKLDKMQAAPIPGIAVGFRIVVARRYRWLEKHPRSMVDLDIVAQLTTIPVDMRRRPVLIEVVIAQTGIDRKVHAIFPDALLVAMAELQKLRAFAGHGDLSAPVIRHVAAEDKSRRDRDWRACAGKFRCPSVGFRRPLVFRYPVQRGNVATQVLVRLPFFTANWD
jgi:hypothetical protein